MTKGAAIYNTSLIKASPFFLLKSWSIIFNEAVPFWTGSVN